MVVRQYKAHGPVTNLLLPIVALDDAVGLVIFAVSMGIALALQGGGLSIYTIALDPLIEILASVALGSVLGLLMTELEKLFYSGSNRLAMTIAFVLLAIALSSYTLALGPVKLAFSSLLVCMMAGTVFCNTSRFSEDIFQRCDTWTVPLYTVFFVLSGAELQLGVFRRGPMILIGLVFILARCAGKYFGARESARAMHGDKNIVRYLGITLFPQAGVALGMVRLAQDLGRTEADTIRNVILFSVMVYELIGPSLTRMALQKAGEIVPIPPHKRTRARFSLHI
jgi:NhaP-type Na+/H+ or K+/H+ antiporter